MRPEWSSPLLVVVTARGGSKRLPGKNLMTLGGRSLLGWTADFVASEGAAECALLSTDDPSIAEEGRRCGLEVPFLRPVELASDTATSGAVVAHALDAWVAAGRQEPECVALLQPTSPFRRRGLLRDAVEMLSREPSANSVVAMTRLHVPARYLFTSTSDGMAQPLFQGIEPAFAPNGSMYVARTAAFRSEGSMYAPPVMLLETGELEAIDVDTAEDLRLAEAVLAIRPDFAYRAGNRPAVPDSQSS